MCIGREESAVIPTKPSAAMGWWIGSVIERKGKFLKIAILRVQFPENCTSERSVIYSTPDYVVQFDDMASALEAVDSRCKNLMSVG